MAKSYAWVAYPEPWQILGIRLRPFSLGHYLKLRQFNNSFVSDEPATASLSDLVTGIAVCSMSSHPDVTQDEFWLWWLRPARWNALAWIFRKTNLTPAEKEMVCWGRSCRGVDILDKIKLFSNYINEHSHCPVYMPTDPGKPSKKSGAHWSQAVINGLVSQCGYTQLEAYNISVSKGLHDYMKYAEDNGVVRLASEEECAAFENQGTIVLAGEVANGA